MNVSKVFSFIIMGLVLLASFKVKSQDQVEVSCVAFYNLENLFDTMDDTLIRDEEFLPDGAKNYTVARYNEKINNMAVAISRIGGKYAPDCPDVLGVSEIENRGVLEDLVHTDVLSPYGLDIVHYDSPDKRGVDVGMLYNPKHFEVTNSKSYALKIEGMDNFFTRDQLMVSGNLRNEKTHIIVNHWPSRYGGEKRSRDLRNAAAKLTRHIVDSLQALGDDSRIIVMGDLNDDPTNESVDKYLKTSGSKKNIPEGYLFNPMYEMHKSGIGSLAYRDNWNLFDQIIISSEYLDKDQKTLKFHSAKVFNDEFLKVQDGRYKGYPKRTFVGNTFQGGYSDHFPVYILLYR